MTVNDVIQTIADHFDRSTEHRRQLKAEIIAFLRREFAAMEEIQERVARVTASVKYILDDKAKFKRQADVLRAACIAARHDPECRCARCVKINEALAVV